MGVLLYNEILINTSTELMFIELISKVKVKIDV